MHHVTLDNWSRIASPMHRLDARGKILAALAILLSLVLPQRGLAPLFAFYFVLVMMLALWARLPIAALLARACVVLPFAAGVAVMNLFGGDPSRALAVFGKSYLSALTILVLLATTPLYALLRGMESLGVPRFFLMVAQFVYRYLFVLSEQAQHMMLARRCRAPRPSRGRARALRSSAAGVLAVLFARSYARAERIHRAMLARGFQGHFVLLEQPALRPADALFLAVVTGVVAGVRLLLWKP